MINLPLKNFFVLVGAEVFSKIVTFAAFAYLARLLGAGNFGYIEWAAAVLLCASLIVDQGFSTYGAREIAKNPRSTARLMREIVTARLFLAAGSFICVAVFAALFIEESSVRQLVIVYALSLWLLPFLLQWVFQGHEQMKVVSQMQIIRQSVFAVVIFGCVSGAGDLIKVGLAEIGAVAAAALFGVLMFRKNFSFDEKIEFKISAELFREGAPIGLSQIFWTVKMFGATLILGLLASAEETGLFAGAMRIFIALHVFVWFYYFNFLPVLTRCWNESRENFKSLVKNSLKIVLPVSLLCGIIGVWLAFFVMSAVYGENFAGGGSALQWLALAWTVTAISGHFRFGLIAAGFQRKELITSTLGAISVLILLPWGYRFFGISGAAAALLIAETGILIVAGFYARKLLFGTEALPQNRPKSLLGVAG